MNILFLSMLGMRDINENGIYTDLMRKFRNGGHEVYIVVPCERREGKPTTLYEGASGVHLLSVKTLNVQKTNVIEKGVGQILLERQFKNAIKSYFYGVKFDIILYSTPPITFSNIIKWVKDLNPQAIAYLMLKDIFPQNAVDLGMLQKNGLKGFLYRYFRRKEKELYCISDIIGCMSPENVKYLLHHNPEINSNKVEICPNSYEIPIVGNIGEVDNVIREEVRTKFNLPIDKPIFIYGGNLGKPQGIPFLIECLDSNKNREDCHFLIVGDGFDYPLLESWYNKNNPKSVSIIRRLPKSEYDQLANVCDVGLIFLDYRFTIPNFPSRLLPYLMSKKPIIACTDPNCDTGTIAYSNGFGMWVPSNNVLAFTDAIDNMLKMNRISMGEKAYRFFLQNYTVDHTYDAIMKHVK